jgi:hypothetical protein
MFVDPKLTRSAALGYTTPGGKRELFAFIEPSLLISREECVCLTAVHRQAEDP